jgi:hypothetical protein
LQDIVSSFAKLKKMILRNDVDNAVLQYKQLAQMAPPSSQHVLGLRKWLKIFDPIADSSMNYTERRAYNGEIPAPERIQKEDFSELMSLSSWADSWFGNYLRYSWLKYFFIVRENTPSTEMTSFGA